MQYEKRLSTNIIVYSANPTQYFIEKFEHSLAQKVHIPNFFQHIRE